MNDEFGPNFVTLTDDEGNDIELEYVDALEHNGTTYMAFFPVVEEDSEDEENEEEYGLVILKSQMENGEEFLVTIDDEEEIDKVYDLFHGGRSFPTKSKTSIATDFFRKLR